jgi:hypothetical protein
MGFFLFFFHIIPTDALFQFPHSFTTTSGPTPSHSGCGRASAITTAAAVPASSP